MVWLNYDCKNLLYLPYGMSEQLRIFSVTGTNAVFLCCPVLKLNGCAEKICALGLWGWSVQIQAGKVSGGWGLRSPWSSFSTKVISLDYVETMW